jgi:hypothetical protein
LYEDSRRRSRAPASTPASTTYLWTSCTSPISGFVPVTQPLTIS